MRKTALVLAAIFLGYLSPWMANSDDGLLLFMWFNWLPTLAAQWVWTNNLPLALAIDVSVLAAQYLALFAGIKGMRPLVKVVADFIASPRHRNGLVR